jgi:hypothetical protein
MTWRDRQVGPIRREVECGSSLDYFLLVSTTRRSVQVDDVKAIELGCDRSWHIGEKRIG